jgi:hypothetical protein
LASALSIGVSRIPSIWSPWPVIRLEMASTSRPAYPPAAASSIEAPSHTQRVTSASASLTNVLTGAGTLAAT